MFNKFYEVNNKKRRGGIKKLKIHEHNGHKFVAKFFNQPTFCFFCDKFLWGFGKQGYECQECSAVVHSWCHDKLLVMCTGKNAAKSVATNGISINVPHTFEIHNYFRPTFCQLDGKLLVGLFRQGLKCKYCGFNCHVECKDKVPNSCGVNQELIKGVIDDIACKKSSKKGEDKGKASNKSTKSLSTNSTSIFNKSTIRDENRKATPMFSDFEIKKLVGEGSFGKVYMTKDKYSGRYYAMKALRKDAVLQDDDAVECTMLERDILKLGYNNPYLTKLYCSFQTEEHLFFVMEFLNGGDLMFHIIQSKRFEEQRAIFYSCEIICGLQYLHANNIIYRDLKLDNILLDPEGHCKLADFGMSKRIDKIDGKTRTFCGTPDYIAPEIIRGEYYDYAVDWWSFGVLMYEMITGSSPFYGNNEEELFMSIETCNVHYPPALSDKSQTCIKRLFEKDASKRLGTKSSPHGTINEQEVFSNIDWNKLEQRQIEPPYKPLIRSSEDTTNIDTDTLSQEAKLSEIDKTLLKTIDPGLFRGFSFVSPEFTHR